MAVLPALLATADCAGLEAEITTGVIPDTESALIKLVGDALRCIGSELSDRPKAVDVAQRIVAARSNVPLSIVKSDERFNKAVEARARKLNLAGRLVNIAKTAELARLGAILWEANIDEIRRSLPESDPATAIVTLHAPKPITRQDLHSKKPLPGEKSCGATDLAEVAPHTLFVAGVSCTKSAGLLNTVFHGLGSEVGWACTGFALVLCAPGGSVSTDAGRFASGTHIRAMPVNRWPEYPGEAKLGDRGRTVRVWQEILIEADVIRDIPANLDGYYGPGMTDAVRTLQRSWRWKNADGVAGPATYDRLTR